MKFEDFFKLDFRQQDALIVAMNVRNALEKFHGNMPDGSVGFISDKQMKQLNQTIRTAIFEALYIKHKWIMSKKPENRKYWERFVEWLIMMIPDYWEIPTEKEFLKKLKKIEQEVHD